MKILITIVLYKEKLLSSVSYQSIKKVAKKVLFDYLFYIHDNSPQSQLVTEDKVYYIHSSQNVGLSKAYNEAASYGKENGFDYILLLDQDTLWSEDFFEKLIFVIKQNPNINLFAPVVIVLKKKNIQFSPKRFFLTRTFNTNITQGIFSIKKYLIVNSGMCINIKAFLNCGGYDEEVYLDYSDVRFLEKFSVQNNHFYLFNSMAYQDFSNDETDYQKLLNRFYIYLECLLCCPKKNIIVKLAFVYTVFLHSVVLALRTKKLFFVKLFFTHYLFK